MAEQMKPSGINWIGNIPNDWMVSKIKYNVSVPVTDGPHETPIFVDEGVPFYSVDGIQKDRIVYEPCRYISSEDADRYDIKAKPMLGDILMGKAASVGKIAIIDRNIRLQVWSPLAIIRSDEEKIHNRYLKYYLLSDSAQIEIDLKSTTNTQKNVAMEDIENINITTAPIMEQRLIADFLDKRCAEIDSIIADIEKQIETLQKYKKSLITEAVTKGLDYSVTMKNSGVTWIGEIPAEWKISRVKYLIDDKHPYPIGDGDHGMIKADDYLDEGIPYIRVLNLTWGDGMNLDNLVFISEKMNAMIKNSELRPNDILIAKTGATIGKTAIVPESLPISNTTSHVGKITLPNTHCAKYFFYVMTSDIVQKQIQDISAMQSTRPELGIEGMRDLAVVVPPLTTQEHIAEYLDEHCAKMDEILRVKKEQLEIMKKHKASIIYEYVTGKKRVKEAL